MTAFEIVVIVFACIGYLCSIGFALIIGIMVGAEVQRKNHKENMKS